MNKDAAARLIELNRRFYQTFGREFSSTRMRLQPGVNRLLERIAAHESILDLGCGNGELARALARRGFRGRYLGLDFSRPLLQEAGALPDHFAFAEADLTAPDWPDKLNTEHRTLNTEHWSLVTAFAVLHHIPSRELRLDLLNKVHALLAPGGVFIHSEWQFLSSEKWRGRIQPWSEAGLTEADVDPGDYLLDWRGGGRGLRYVHAFDEAELNALAAASRFEVRETFSSDGENGRLGLYQIWERRS